jgi:hypothetical protein
MNQLSIASLRRRKRDMRLILCGAILFVITTSVNAQTAGQDLTGGDLVDAIISPDSCATSPCFLSQSVENIPLDSVASILENSDLVEIESIDRTTNEIRWEWSTETIQRLSYEKVDTYSIIDENVIRFDEDGNLLSYSLVFHIPLDEMLNTFGEAFIVLPWTSHRILGAGYAILYPQLSGYFVVYADCGEPYFTDTSDVTNYVFVETMQIEIRQIHQFAIWNGYETALPNCSTFPAG